MSFSELPTTWNRPAPSGSARCPYMRTIRAHADRSTAHGRAGHVVIVVFLERTPYTASPVRGRGSDADEQPRRDHSTARRAVRATDRLGELLDSVRRHERCSRIAAGQGMRHRSRQRGRIIETWLPAPRTAAPCVRIEIGTIVTSGSARQLRSCEQYVRIAPPMIDRTATLTVRPEGQVRPHLLDSRPTRYGGAQRGVVAVEHAVRRHRTRDFLLKRVGGALQPMKTPRARTRNRAGTMAGIIRPWPRCATTAWGCGSRSIAGPAEQIDALRSGAYARARPVSPAASRGVDRAGDSRSWTAVTSV
jgi:hypothetical protein